jgi:hypothetical protein
MEQFMARKKEQKNYSTEQFMTIRRQNFSLRNKSRLQKEGTKKLCSRNKHDQEGRKN